MEKKELLEILYRMEEQINVINESVQDVKEKLLKEYTSERTSLYCTNQFDDCEPGEKCNCK